MPNMDVSILCFHLSIFRLIWFDPACPQILGKEVNLFIFTWANLFYFQYYMLHYLCKHIVSPRWTSMLSQEARTLLRSTESTVATLRWMSRSCTLLSSWKMTNSLRKYGRQVSLHNLSFGFSCLPYKALCSYAQTELKKGGIHMILLWYSWKPY